MIVVQQQQQFQLKLESNCYILLQQKSMRYSIPSRTHLQQSCSSCLLPAKTSHTISHHHLLQPAPQKAANANLKALSQRRIERYFLYLSPIIFIYLFYLVSPLSYQFLAFASALLNIFTTHTFLQYKKFLKLVMSYLFGNNGWHYSLATNVDGKDFC